MGSTLKIKIKKLKEQFSQSLEGKLEEFDVLLSLLKSSLETENALAHLKAIQSLAHNLAGTAGTFQFNETYKISKNLETQCYQDRIKEKPISPDQASQINALIQSLCAAIAQDQLILSASPDLIDQEMSQERPEKIIKVLIVEDDPIQAHALQIQLVNLGFYVDCFSLPEEIRHIDFDEPEAPDLILMDIMIKQDQDAGLRLVQELREESKLNIPVIFVSARNDFKARIEAIRAGGNGYIAKPIKILELTETIKRLSAEKNQEPFDVLLIGANENLTDTFTSILDDTDMKCRSIIEPKDTLTALEENSPHVILMNSVLCDSTGKELAMMIRQVNDDYARIPIVFFSENEPNKQHLLDLRASGDDMLILPVDPDIWVLSLRARCKRTRDLRDIIKQRRQGEQRFHAISETVNDAVITTNSLGRIIFWNMAAEHMFGHEATDIIGMPITEIFAKHYQDDVMLSGPGRLIQGENAEYKKPTEMHGVSLTGHEFPIEVSATKWKSHTHSYIGYIIRDITERKKAEHALQENRAALAEKTRILETTLDSIDQGFVVWDETFHMLAHSKKCLDFWYQPHEDIIAPRTHMIELMRHLAKKGAFGEGDIEELANQQVGRVINEGGHSSEEIELLDDRILDIHRFPLPQGGYVAKYTDVTEQKANSHDLEVAVQNAEDANQHKSEFLSSMSHELRTPLNTILGFGQMLALNKKEPLSSRQAEQIGHILKAGQHLLTLIDDVLDLARIEAGKINIQCEDISYKTLIFECLMFVEAMAENNNITITTDTSDEQPQTLFGDEKCTKQVIINFLSNAIKYNRKNGTINITFEQMPNGKGRVSVMDSGNGIPKHKQSELFQTFSRLEAENSDIEGTGIGLSVCKNLIEQMNGEIGVESVENEGSTFWFELPLIKPV